MEYRICTFCVMDSTASEITFDDNGRCNFCKQSEQAIADARADYWNLDNHIEAIRSEGKYDCLIGLSGGVDSSFTLHQAIAHGLRPLCFSVDTGYNKPEADENIMKLVETLKVPFMRIPINIERFQELQSTFLRAGVKNAEIPTDHVLMAVSYQLANRYGINTIISGGNVFTESIMPPSWSYSARDLKHIEAIYERFSGKRLTGLPVCGLLEWNWYRWAKGIHIFYLLDYCEYNRSIAEEFLIKTYGFKSTGEKHEENYFTWWYQNWYLFEKWGIDKRKAHYSSMIVSGEMTRSDAMEKLSTSPIYPELGLETRVLKYPNRPHEAYPTDKWYGRIASVIRLCKS